MGCKGSKVRILSHRPRLSTKVANDIQLAAFFIGGSTVYSTGNANYAIREKRNLEKDLFPFLGLWHIGEIEAIELLVTVRRVPVFSIKPLAIKVAFIVASN